MPSKVKIAIPTPCHENWEAMSPTDKGRFCASCQKNVIDFTNASDRQIAAALRQSDNLCGRFNASQLERDLVIPKEKNKLWIATSAAVVTLLSIGNHTISAQTVAITEQTDNKTDDINSTLVDKRIITGTVVYVEKYVIPGTTVRNKNSGKALQTDIGGRFEIAANAGDILEFEFVGMCTVTQTVDERTDYNIVMKDEIIYTDLVIGIIIPRRTFFGRIFHSIGNIFR